MEETSNHINRLDILMRTCWMRSNNLFRNYQKILLKVIYKAFKVLIKLELNIELHIELGYYNNKKIILTVINIKNFKINYLIII